MHSIYSRYRSQDYLRARRTCEPWYTSKVNSSNLDDVVVKNRKDGLRKFLKPYLPDKTMA